MLISGEILTRQDPAIFHASEVRFFSKLFHRSKYWREE